MGAVYAPTANIVSNILNRRTKSQVVDVLKSLTDFENLVQTSREFGDTLEHIDTALSESEAYSVTTNQTANYKATLLNKVYNKINFSKVYYASTPTEEYKKAIGDPSALADLANRVIGKQNKTWKFDMYNEFVSLMENDADIVKTYVPDFSTFLTSDTKAERDEKIEKFLQQVFETLEKMKFYSADFITVDASLTAEEKARFIATAPSENMTLYLNSIYFSWSQVDLSRRFRNFLDLNKNIKIKIIKFADNSRVGYISHDLRYGFYPKITEAQETRPFGAVRTDHALIVEGTFANITLFPATVLVPSALYPAPPA